MTLLNSPIATDMDLQRQTLLSAFDAVRRQSELLCQPLVTEDYVVQSMPDVSPTKWHLAHTSWFFETFILKNHLAGYVEFDPAFAFLFNSYYVTIGDRHCRQNRGQLSRPTVEDVYRYRAHVDAGMRQLLHTAPADVVEQVRPLLRVGVNHEQQHGELMLTDIKHVFWVNPLRPAYRNPPEEPSSVTPPMKWVNINGGVRTIGHHATADAFAFDNESPRHKVYLEDFSIASRPVTNREYKQFMSDGGYRRTELWLSMGAGWVKQEAAAAPLYWLEQDGQWMNHTMWGLVPVDDNAPVTHVNYFEADAFARWAGARLPTEAEWEVAGESALEKSDASDEDGLTTRDIDDNMTGNFVESGRYHPSVAAAGEGLQQMFGNVWEWTSSAYLPYPGYQPPSGALGEYNGKFMCNQFVLRGGSCATPRSHVRPTYRNFFPPDARWQFSGIRLARGL